MTTGDIGSGRVCVSSHDAHGSDGIPDSALYRMRWQIELAFKRMKSLLGSGKVKKVDPVGARAWLQGKLLIARLIEKMIAVGDLFSPRMAWRAA